LRRARVSLSSQSLTARKSKLPPQGTKKNIQEALVPHIAKPVKETARKERLSGNTSHGCLSSRLIV
jgi:hypothetical protein